MSAVLAKQELVSVRDLACFQLHSFLALTAVRTAQAAIKLEMENNKRKRHERQQAALRAGLQALGHEESAALEQARLVRPSASESFMQCLHGPCMPSSQHL